MPPATALSLPGFGAAGVGEIVAVATVSPLGSVLGWLALLSVILVIMTSSRDLVGFVRLVGHRLEAQLAPHTGNPFAIEVRLYAVGVVLTQPPARRLVPELRQNAVGVS